MIHKIILFAQKLLRTDYNKNILKIATGSSLAVMINFLSIPVITRIYSPAEFGGFQLIMSYALVFSSIFSLKYEQSIVLPSKEFDAKLLYGLSVYLSLFFGLFFFLIIASIRFIFQEPSSSTIIILFEYDYLIILIAAMITLSEIHRYYGLRMKQFNKLSISKVIESIATQGLKILSGVICGGFFWLSFSQLLGSLINLIYLFINFKSGLFNKVIDIIRIAKKYKKFPIFDAPAFLINSLSIQLPILMMSMFFNESYVGVFSMGVKVTSIPMLFLGTSFSQVYFQRATESFSLSSQVLKDTFFSTFKKLIILGIFIFGVVYFFGPFLVEIIFGPEWYEVNNIIRFIIVWKFMEFIVSPLSNTFAIINRNEYSLILTTLSLVIRFFAIYIFRDDFYTMLIALSLSIAGFYFTYLIIIIRKIKI